MEPTIRPFTVADRDAVVALSLRAWAPVFASMEQVLGPSGVFGALYPDWRESQRRAVRDTCDGAERVWVADAGVVAGFVAAVLHREQRMGEISMLAVDPAHQRGGIGSRLTAVAVDWFREQGTATAMVSTGGDPGHAPARAAYAKAGFTAMPVVNYFRTLDPGPR